VQSDRGSWTEGSTGVLADSEAAKPHHSYPYLDKSTTSRLVDGLERKGYAVRAPHPEDGRAVCVRATTEGECLLASIRDSILAEEKDLLAGFDPEVRQAMPDVIRRPAAPVTAARPPAAAAARPTGWT